MATILQRIWNAVSSIETGYSVIQWFMPESTKAIFGIIVMLEVASISLFSGKDPATIVVFSLAAGMFIIWFLNGIIWIRSTKTKTEEIKTISKFPLEDYLYIGIPEQRASESFLSWWHIPIYLKRGYGINSLEDCLVSLKEDTLFSAEKPMRWESPNNIRGIDSITLRVGPDPQMVPVMIRSEKQFPSAWGPLPLGTARITGDNWLVRGNPDDLLPGRYVFKLEIKSFDKRWPNELKWSKRFLINIPEGTDSNGHFLVMPYELDKLTNLEFFSISGN